MWLAQFVCAPQFFKTPKGLCGHTVLSKMLTKITMADNQPDYFSEHFRHFLLNTIKKITLYLQI
jgi:hypothetical protein